MTLSNRIINYILKRDTTTLMQLEGVVLSKGFTLDDMFRALETVHRDKRIDYRANASGEITYRPAIAKTPKPNSHLAWLQDNYPRMDKTNDGSGIDIPMDHLFLKTKEERYRYSNGSLVPKDQRRERCVLGGNERRWCRV